MSENEYENKKVPACPECEGREWQVYWMQEMAAYFSPSGLTDHERTDTILPIHEARCLGCGAIYNDPESVVAYSVLDRLEDATMEEA